MRDKSLEEISILKLLIFTLSFISICMTLILFLLLPTLRNYKEISLRENSQIAMLNAAKAKFYASRDKVLSLRREDNKSLERFERSFDVKVLKDFSQRYFKDVKIKENELPEAEEYLKHSLKISANIESPKNLYDFIDALGGFGYLVKVDYPLNLKAAEKGINVDFIIKIYSAAS